MPTPVPVRACDLLVSEEMFRVLGPAINSGRGMFLYGYPGNGKEFLALEAVAHLLKTVAVDALEQEQLASSAAQAVGQQPADRRSAGGQHAIEPEMWPIVPDIYGQDGVHGDGNG